MLEKLLSEIDHDVAVMFDKAWFTGKISVSVNMYNYRTGKTEVKEFQYTERGLDLSGVFDAFGLEHLSGTGD